MHMWVEFPHVDSQDIGIAYVAACIIRRSPAFHTTIGTIVRLKVHEDSFKDAPLNECQLVIRNMDRPRGFMRLFDVPWSVEGERIVGELAKLRLWHAEQVAEAIHGADREYRFAHAFSAS